MSFEFKKMGMRTLTNDFMNCCHQIGLALIENSKRKDKFQRFGDSF